MKKRFLFIPVLIISVLLSCIPFTTLAVEDDLSKPYEYTYFADSLPSPYDTYLMFSVDNNLYYCYGTENFLLDDGYSDGNYTLNSKGSYRGIRCFQYNSLRPSNPSGGDSYLIQSVNVDTTLGVISFINPTKGNDLVFRNYENLTLVIGGDIIFNNGVPYDPDALDVTVTTNPLLEGSINRTRTLNDVTATIDFLNMRVYNKGKTGIQYFMCICEEGYSPDSLYAFSNLSNGDSLTMSFDSNCRFVFLREEDVYLNQVNAFKSLILSPWHYCAANSSDDAHFKWSMFDLLPNHNYDIVVYAMPNSNDAVSTIADEVGNFILPDDSSGNFKSDFSVDFSKVQEVYRSTFSVVNPAAYDPNSSNEGIIPNNPDFNYRQECSIIRGIYDDNGKYHSEDYDLLKNGASYYSGDGLVPASQSPYYHDYSNVNNYPYNYTSYKSTSYSSLLAETTGVFAFFGSVLGFFPSVFITVFNLGMWAIIILLIIRRLH